VSPTDLVAHLDEEHLAVYRSLPDDMWSGIRDVTTTRARFDAQMEAIGRPPLPAGLEIDDRLAPGHDGAPDILVRLYRPADLPAPAATLYWIHGGGLVLGDVAMNDAACAGIANRLGILVASVEYRLAPEFPFPAPLEDCYTGLRWLARHADELGVDPARIAIAGGSAGGALAAGLALLARDRGEVAIAFQLLISPMLDDRNRATASPASEDPRLWNRAANQVGWDFYLEGRAGADDVSPYAAPARATDLAGLPPAYINVGDLDLFLDEDVAYALALARARVPVELHVYPGAFHGSILHAPRAALSRRWLADERAALARALGVEVAESRSSPR
jgi:acetyl esterase/lipase